MPRETREQVREEMRGIRRNTRFIKELWTGLFEGYSTQLLDPEKNVEDNQDSLRDAAKLADLAIELYEERWK